MQEEVRKLRSLALEMLALCDRILSKGEVTPLSSSGSPKPDEGEVVAYVRERVEGLFGDEFEVTEPLLRAIAREVRSWEEVRFVLDRMAQRAEQGWRPQNPYPYLLTVLRRKHQGKPAPAPESVQEEVSALVAAARAEAESDAAG